MAQQEQSISKVVESIIESLSDAVSQLILLVIVFQEQNAAPPPQLPTASAQVDKTAKILVDVAKNLADEEYSEYPDIKKEIVDAANDVNKSSNDLMAAVNHLKTAQDRKAAWDKLVDACKVISGKTILLLQIVYGAELKRIFAAAQATRDKLNQLDHKKAHTDPQAFADAAGDVATRANQLAEYLKAKAADEDSPLVKQQLLASAKELEDGAANIINTANKILENPDDQNAINQFHKEKRDLEDAIVRATEPLKEQLAANQAARNAFDQKVRPAPTPDTRAPRRPHETRPIDPYSHDKDRETRERARANLPAHDRNALNSADRVRDDIGDIRDRAYRGEPDNVNHFAKQLDNDHGQLQRDGRAWADKADDPARRKKLLDALSDMDKALPLYKATATQLAQHPDEKAAKKNFEDAHNKYEDALNNATDAIDPGASLASQAAQLARDVEKVRTDAKAGDAPGVAVGANSAGRREARIQEAAKAIADACDDPMRKKAINNAAADLARLLPRQIDAANRTLESQSEPNRNELDNHTEHIKDVLQQLASAANPSPQEQLAEAAARIKDGLVKVERGVQAGDNKQIEDGLKQVDAASKPFLRNAQGHADSALNPHTRRQLQEAINALQQPLRDLPPDARKAGANNKDIAALAKLADDVDKINANVDAVLKGTNAAAIAEAKKENDELTRLANSFKKKDLPDVAAAGRKAATHQAKLAELVPRAAADSDDPLRRKNMLSALDNLDRLLPQMLSASEAAVQRPDDKAAAAKLDDNRKQMQLELARLVDALNPAVPAEASRGKRFDPDDPVGRKAALSALDQLERLIPVMNAAAQRLAKSPEDPEARENLNRVFNDIGAPMDSIVARFATPEDQLEAAVRTLEDDLKDVIIAARGNDTPAFVNASQDMAARQEKIADAVRARVAMMADDPVRRKRIENALDALERALPAAIAAAKEVHAKKGDPDAAKKLHRAAELYKGAVDSLARSVKPTSEQRMLENARKLERALQQLQEATARGDKPAAEALLNVVGDLHDAIQRDGNYEAAHARDPKTRTAIENLLKGLNDQVQRALPDSTHRAVANPQDGGARRAQDDSVREIKDALGKLLDATKARPMAEAQKETGDLDALHNAVARGNGAAAADAANNLAKQQAEVLRAAKLEADSASDPARKKRIQDTIAALERALPATQQAAHGFASRPNDDGAQNDLLHAVTMHAEPLAQLEALVKPNTRNEVSAVARMLEAALARAAQAAHKGDKPALDEALAKVKGAHEALQAIGKAVAANTKSDQRRDKLNKAIADLDGLINKVSAASRAAVDAPGDKAKHTELDNLVSECRPPIRTIENEVRGEDADVGEKIATAAAKANRSMAKMNPPKGRKIDPHTVLDAAKQLSDDLRDLIGSARDDLSKTPITSDKAKAAFDLERLLASLDAAGQKGGKAADVPAVAQSLNRVLETLNNKAEIPDAPPTSFSNALSAVAQDIQAQSQKSGLPDNDPLLLAMRSIAEEIRKLASAAARGARQEILLTGNVLAKLINAFCNELKNYASRCKDFRLADRLIRISTAMRNLGTQVKIVCSVKAAATNQDTPDTDEQIISITRLLGSNLNDSIETVSTMVKTGRLAN